MARPNRLDAMDVLLAMIIGIAVAGLAILLRTPWHSWGDDFAGYLLQARAMAAGQLRAEVLLNGSLVAASDSLPVPAAYSWGFPTLLWMGSRIGGWNLMALKTIGGLSLGCASAFTFALGRSYLSRSGSVLAAALVGFQPALLQSADLLLSDLPFLALAAAALFVMDRHARVLDADDAACGPGGPLVAAVLTVAAFTVRANAVALGGAFLLMHAWFWVTRPARRPSVLRSAGWYAGAAATLLVLYTAWSPGEAINAYAKLSVFSPGSMIYMAVHTGMLVPAFVPFTMLPDDSAVAAVVALAVCAGLVLAGTLARRPFGLGLVLFVVLDLGLLLIMPFVQGVRFLYPLLIPGAILALCGVQQIAASVHNPLRLPGTAPRRDRAMTTGLVGVLVVLMALHGYRVAHRPKAYQADGPYSVVSQELAGVIVARVPAGDRIAFFRPRALRLLTSRQAVAIRTAEHADRAAWFVLTKWQPPESRSLLAKYQLGAAYFAERPTEFERLFENGQFVLYHRLARRP